MSVERPHDRLQQYIPAQLLAKLEAARAGAGGVQGERRVVTVLFCDVRGSTAMAERLDPEEWAEIINGAFERLIAPVYRYEGTLARLMGDGILAFFGAPIAHEDDPERAVLAGLGIVEGIQGYREHVRREWDLDFDVRVGINTGLVVVGEVGSDLRVEYTALGDAVNLASRMEQTAEPGTVQIAEATYRAVGPLFEVAPLGAIEVKGKAEPVAAYRVLRRRAGAVAARGVEGLSSPLVGRERELRTLRARVDELLDGSGQVVSVIGEAGLGKSRLVAELRGALAADGLLGAAKDRAGGGPTDMPPAALRWLECRALSYEAMIPYAPFVPLLSSHLDLGEGDDAAQYARIAERVAAVAPGREGELAPYLATLLGVAVPGADAERVRYLEPQELRERVFAAVGGYLAALAHPQAGTRRPTVLFFEDLHWADPTSLDLLERLLALTDEAPLLLLAAFRPHRQEPSWRFHELAQRDYPHRYAAIELAPLDDRQSRELLANLLEVEGLDEAVRRKILERAEGNPFYVEETLRGLVDAGSIARQNGRWLATRQVEAIAVPDTLAGVLTARLDRLDDETRRVAQMAAVIGREFPLALLAEVYGGDDDGASEAARVAVERALRELQRRELVRERGGPPERAYRFKHVLTQEAAYSSRLLSRRRALHRRVAETLERGAPEQVEELARHYWEAREYARALPHLTAAGDRAARAFAPRAAAEQYSRAIEAATRAGAPVPVELYRARGQAYDTLGDFDAAQSDYEAALRLAQQAGDRRAEWQALLDLGSLWASRDYGTTGEYFKQALALARELGDPAALAASLNRLGNWHLNAGEPQATPGYHREALALYEALGDRRGLAETHDLLTVAAGMRGDMRAAMEHNARAAALFEELGDRRGLAHSLGVRLQGMLGGLLETGDVAADRAAYAAALRDAERARAMVREIGWRSEEVVLLTLVCDAYGWRGEYVRALEAGREAVAIAEEIGHRQWLTASQADLAMLHLDLLDLPEARRLLERALGLALETGSAVFTALVAAYLALTCAEQGDLDAAGRALAAAPDADGPVQSEGHWAVRLARAALAQAGGDPATALHLADGLEQSVALPPLPLLLRARVRGEALAALGRAAEGEAELRAAQEPARQRGYRPMLWRLHAALGRLYLATGRRQDAGRELAAARAIVEELAAGVPDEALREGFLRGAEALLSGAKDRAESEGGSGADTSSDEAEGSP